MKTVYDENDLADREYREDCLARKVAKEVSKEILQAEERGAKIERERIRLEVYKHMSKGVPYSMYLFEIEKILDNK